MAWQKTARHHKNTALKKFFQKIPAAKNLRDARSYGHLTCEFKRYTVFWARQSVCHHFWKYCDEKSWRQDRAAINLRQIRRRWYSQFHARLKQPIQQSRNLVFRPNRDGSVRFRQKIFPIRLGLRHNDQKPNAPPELGQLLANFLAHEQTDHHDAGERGHADKKL